MRTKLPWGQRPRRPGSGLRQIMPSTPPPASVVPAHPPPVAELPTLRECPACEGSTFERLDPAAEVAPETTDPANVRSYGAYRVVQCRWCDGSGMVTSERAIEIYRELNAAKL